MTNLTKEDLINFEEDIAAEFGNKKILAPIHLQEGCEDQLINFFKENNIGKDDWIFCNWRSHLYHLLKGISPETLKKDILLGKSISLCYPEYNTFSSAIVGGNIPIAVGTAFGLKLQNKKGRVFCQVGDMTSEGGIFYENLKYAVANELPIKFIIEDNNKSVCSPTRETWGIKELFAEKIYSTGFMNDYIYYFKYNSKWKHSGTNVRIQF